MISVVKEMTFDAAHMLSNYLGKCSNLHGHTYKLQVVMSLPSVPQDTGMVMDFNVLQAQMEDVVSCYDHSIVFSAPSKRSSAEQVLYTWAMDNHMSLQVMPESLGLCTVENIATDILHRMGEDHIAVRLWETPTSFVEVTC